MRIQGSILDQDMNTVPFANVTEKGTNNRVSADADGRFSINVASANSVLVFSHASHDSVELRAGSFISYVEMPSNLLDEVVITPTRPQTPVANPDNKTDLTFLYVALAAGIVYFLTRPATAATPKKPVPTAIL